MMVPRKYDIFISYSAMNVAEAESLRASLESHGLNCFLAKKDISPGVDFADTVRRALRSSDEIWILMTPNSLKSEWVITEAGAAWGLNKRIVPILLRCSPKDLPDRLRRLQCVDFHDVRNFVKGYARLARSGPRRPGRASMPPKSTTDPPLAAPAHHRDDHPKEIVGKHPNLGPIQTLMDDPSISKVMVNSPDDVYFERDGIMYQSDLKFRGNDHLMQVIESILSFSNRRVEPDSPYVDARLPDGSNVNIVIPPAVETPSVTIYKNVAHPHCTLNDLVEFGALSKDISDYLHACVHVRLNILVSGLAGAFTPLVLDALCSCIPDNERIITIGEPTGVRLQQPHTIGLQVRPPDARGRGGVARQGLLQNALRMRPGRLIMDEVSGSEVVGLLEAIDLGHWGFLGTIIADSPRDVLSRLENLVHVEWPHMPLPVVRARIASAIQVVVHVERFRDGIRRITHVTETAGMKGREVKLRDLFEFRETGVDENERVLGEHRATGIRSLHDKQISDWRLWTSRFLAEGARPPDEKGRGGPGQPSQ